MVTETREGTGEWRGNRRRNSKEKKEIRGETVSEKGEQRKQ